MGGSETAGVERLVRPGGPLDRFTRWVAFIGLIGLLLIALVIVGDILMRFLFNSPIEGLEDISKFTFAVVVATCFPAGLIQGHNVAIRFLGRGLGPRAFNWLETFGALCTLVFFGFLAWRFGAFTMEEAANHRVTQTLELQTAPYWGAITLIIAISVPVQIVVAAAWARRAYRGKATDGGGHGEG